MKELLTGKVMLVSGGTQGLGAGDRPGRAPGRAPPWCLRAQRRARREGRRRTRVASARTRVSCRPTSATWPRRRPRSRRPSSGTGGSTAWSTPPGLTTRGTMLDTTPELFDQHIAVNLRAPFFLMQAAIADMKQRGAPGTIVNIISIDSHGGQSFLAPYVAAKAGLAGLTKNAAHAHRWDRIRINGLNMGWSATDGEDLTQRRAASRTTAHRAPATGRPRPARPCRWANSARPTRSPTSSCSCCPTAAASSPGRSSTGTRTSSAASVTDAPTVTASLHNTHLEKESIMRLGLIGLGRIGAFHADTLSQLARVDSLVVTDAVPAVTKTGRRDGRRRQPPTPGEPAQRRRRRHRHRRGHQRPHRS